VAAYGSPAIVSNIYASSLFLHYFLLSVAGARCPLSTMDTLLDNAVQYWYFFRSVFLCVRALGILNWLTCLSIETAPSSIAIDLPLNSSCQILLCY